MKLKLRERIHTMFHLQAPFEAIFQVPKMLNRYMSKSFLGFLVLFCNERLQTSNSYINGLSLRISKYSALKRLPQESIM